MAVVRGGGVINAALCQLFCLLRPPWLPSDGRPIASLYAPFPRSTTSQNITGLCGLSFMCRGEMFCGVTGRGEGADGAELKEGSVVWREEGERHIARCLFTRLLSDAALQAD